MARRVGDLCFPASKYIQDGQEKTRWMKVGVLLDTDKGFRVKLDAIPVVTDPSGLWLSCFEPRDGEGQQQKPAQAASQAAPAQTTSEPDVPF